MIEPFVLSSVLICCVCGDNMWYILQRTPPWRWPQ